MILKQSKKLRIDRLLSNLGIVERSSVPRFLNEKRVTISGRKATISSKAAPEEIRIDGKPIENPSLLHLALHKPSGYICSTVNDGEHKVIYDLLPKEFVNRKPIPSIAGRLDKWVTGLVILSQDGKLVDRIITPKDDGCGKDYEVVLKNKLGGEEKGVFESGKLLLRGEETPCKPAKFEVLDDSKNIVKVTLYEGRYHQVRRMFAANDNKAMEIHRTRIGPVELGDLALGKWRHLTEKEIQDLYNIQVSETKKKQSNKPEKQNKKPIKQQQQEEDDYDLDRTYDDYEFIQGEELFNNEEVFNDEKEYEYDEEDYIEEEEEEKTKVGKKDGEIQSVNKNEKELDYQNKLKLLIKDEISSSGSPLMDTLPILETEEEINKSISKQLQELYDNQEDKLNSHDPFQDLRQQIMNKMRLKMKNRNLVYDQESGSYLSRHQVQDRISDKALNKLIDSDQDFKEFEQLEMDQALEEQEEQEKKQTQKREKRKGVSSKSINNGDKEDGKNINNRVKSKPDKVEGGSEIYEYDSTPLDPIIKQKTKIHSSKNKKRLLSSKTLKRNK